MDYEFANAQEFWRSVISRTYEIRPRVFSLSKLFPDGSQVPRPESTGNLLKRHIGEIKGQIADWRASFIDSEEGFHAVEFQDRYECHIDKWDPLKNAWKHLVEDSPGTLALIFTALGITTIAGLAYYFGKKDKSGTQEESDKDYDNY